MKKLLSIFLVILPILSMAQFAPPAGQEGSTAINADSSAFVGWATGCVVERGPRRIDKPALGLASYGTEQDALGKADDTLLVSLGDGGHAILTFASPICNQSGPDFAVFENPFPWSSDSSLFFLELAFVEVSSDGEHFFRFPAVSYIPEAPQITSFQCTDPRMIHNFAGKYLAHYGTPFDLDDLPDDELLDKNKVTHVKVVDVVGTIKPEYATYDSEGHIVNDPWPTPFESSGFDLDAVGVIHDLAHSAVHESNEQIVSLFPNPAFDVLNVQGADIQSVSIYAMDGQRVVETNTTPVIVSDLAPGVYLVRVFDGGKIIAKKLIKR